MAKKKKTMKWFTLTVTQTAKFEAEDLAQIKIIADDIGLKKGDKAGAFVIEKVEVAQDEEFSILPDGLTKSRMTKVQRFIYEVEKLLRLADAKLTSAMTMESIPGSYKWVVDTQVGPYVVLLHHKPDERADRSSVWSIMGRFVDYKAAHGRFNCNKFNGKHNVHQYKPWMAIEAFREILTIAKGIDICEPYTEENYVRN